MSGVPLLCLWVATHGVSGDGGDLARMSRYDISSAFRAKVERTKMVCTRERPPPTHPPPPRTETQVGIHPPIGGDPNWVRHEGDGSQHVISLRGLRRRLRLRPGSGRTSHDSRFAPRAPLRDALARSCSAVWSVQHTAARDISVERRCSRHAPPVRTTRSCLRMHRKRPSQSRWSAFRRGGAFP
jgi:hypothetical protein